MRWIILFFSIVLSLMSVVAANALPDLRQLVTMPPPVAAAVGGAIGVPVAPGQSLVDTGIHTETGKHVVPALSSRDATRTSSTQTPGSGKSPVEFAVPGNLTGSTALVAARVSYEPGAITAARKFTEMRLIALETGVLTMRIDGTAVLDRAANMGSPLTGGPIPASGAIELYPGDLLVIPLDAASVIRNPGRSHAVTLEISLLLPQPLTPMTDGYDPSRRPGGVHRERLAASDLIAPGQPATVTISRLVLPAGATWDAGPMTPALMATRPIADQSTPHRVALTPGYDAPALDPVANLASARIDTLTPQLVLLVSVAPRLDTAPPGSVDQ